MNCDFLIIGGGIAGASAGYFLANSGKVILAEKESQPGYHTTGRSAAFFVESYGNDEIRALTLAAKPFLENPPEGFTDTPILTPRRSLTIARADQMDELREFAEGVAKLVDDSVLLSAEEVCAEVPCIRGDYVAGGLLEPAAKDIDVNALHQGYLRGLKARGGEVSTDCEIMALEKTNDGWLARTNKGDIAARFVVNAAGAWGDDVAAKAGLAPIGLTPKRRTAIVFPITDWPDHESWPVVIDVDEQFYFKPESGRILASPADETPMPPCDVQPDEYDIAVTVDRLQKATSLEVPRIDNKWAGLRTFASDKTMVIGEGARAPGFFWCCGQGGYGIMTSPAVGRLVASLINGDGMLDDLAAHGGREEAYSPKRFT